MFPVIFSIILFYVFGWVGVLHLSYEGVSFRKSKLIFWLFSVYLVLFFGLRNKSVGTDTKFYVEYFLFPYNGYGFSGSQREIGFSIYNSIVSFFTSNVTLYLLICSAISFIGLLLYARKESRNVLLFFCFFWIFSTTENIFILEASIIRQCMAISLCMLFLYWWEKQKKGSVVSLNAKARPEKIYITFFAIAIVSIHYSSVVFFLLFAIACFWKLKMNQLKTLLIINPVLYLLGASGFTLDRFFMVFVKNISIFSGYIYYLDGSKEGAFSQSSTWVNMLSLPLACFLEMMFFYYFYKRENLENSLQNKIFILSVLLTNVLCNNLMWGRMLLYGTILFLVVAPKFMDELKLRWRILFFVLISGLYLIKTWHAIEYQYVGTTGNVIFPYIFLN